MTIDLPCIRIYDPFWVMPADDLGFSDFNKEIVGPDYQDGSGENPLYPNGVVGIRQDGDFYTVATLPYHFRDVSIEEIVSILWPGIADPIFGIDVYTEKQGLT